MAKKNLLADIIFKRELLSVVHTLVTDTINTCFVILKARKI